MKNLTQSILLLFLLLFLWLPLRITEWHERSRKKTQQPNNGFCYWKKSLCNYHDYDLSTISFGRERASEWWVSGKRAFGICHHNQSRKRWEINKFIALVLWWCLMNQSRFLLTFCILLFPTFLHCCCCCCCFVFIFFLAYGFCFVYALRSFLFSGGILIKRQ